MYVTSGKLATGAKKGVIRTSPLGSCVAVIAYDAFTKIGGIAHIMLPGESPDNKKEEENKYTHNAIINLLNALTLLGTAEVNLEFCLVGGANVLKNENDHIAKNVSTCVVDFLEQKKLIVKKTALCGYQRRTATLNLGSGVVSFTVGDSSEMILWKFSDINSLEDR